MSGAIEFSPEDLAEMVTAGCWERVRHPSCYDNEEIAEAVEYLREQGFQGPFEPCKGLDCPVGHC